MQSFIGIKHVVCKTEQPYTITVCYTFNEWKRSIEVLCELTLPLPHVYH